MIAAPVSPFILNPLSIVRIQANSAIQGTPYLDEKGVWSLHMRLIRGD